MTVIKINDTTDVLINKQKAEDRYFDSLSPLEQVEYIERLNRHYATRRSIRKQHTKRKIKLF